MPASHKLSLFAAILINLNIMIGAGIFINSVALTHYAGFLGFLAYALVGAILLPMILCIAQMVNLHPQGGFLAYGQKEISPFAGFVSAWSYFIGKLGSATLLIHTAFLLLQQIIPLLTRVSIFTLDLLALALFVGLNMLNLRAGKIIQAWLMAFKLIPLLFVIFVGLFLADPSTASVSWQQVTRLSYCIPLVLYTFLGFEATCSLSSNIENARKNGPLAILISYACVIALYMSYQLLVTTSLGTQLGTLNSFLGVFPALIDKLSLSYSPLTMQLLLNCAVAASALGGSYGILLSNCWNLHALASVNYVPFSAQLKQLNVYYIPYLSVIIEGIICALYLAITLGNQIALQLTSVSGSIIAYTISVVALIYAYKKENSDITLPRSIILSGLISCSVLIGFCLRNIILFTPWRMSGFIALLVLGVLYFALRHKEKPDDHTRNCCNGSK